MRVLISWIGKSDVVGAKSANPSDPGPVFRLLRASTSGRVAPFDRFFFLSDFSVEETESVSSWLASIVPEVLLSDFERIGESLENDYTRTYMRTISKTKNILASIEGYARRHITFLLAPGTPAMQLSMVVVASGLVDGESGDLSTEVLTSSREKDVETVALPFQLRVDMRRNAARQFWSDASLPVNIDNAFNHILGKSNALDLAKRLASRVASFGTEAVLLLGETGTGKELFARAIHESSERKKGPFVPVNCSAISESLFESEMFGSTVGAYTGANKNRIGLFQQAHHGTLFLDEIGELPLHHQAKLLRAIQERTIRPVGDQKGSEIPFDAKIILATHRDLGRMVQDKLFREDLYQRISTFIVRIPALRERRGDVGYLARQFLENFCAEFREQVGEISFSPDVFGMLEAYSWPGNIRELQKIVKQLALYAGYNGTISHELISEVLGDSDNADGPYRGFSDSLLAEHFTASMAAVMDRWASWLQRVGVSPDELSFVDGLVWPLLLGHLRIEQSLPFQSKGKESVTSRLGETKMQENDANRKRLELYRKLKTILPLDPARVNQLLGGAES